MKADLPHVKARKHKEQDHFRIPFRHGTLKSDFLHKERELLPPHRAARKELVTKPIKAKPISHIKACN